MRRLICTILIAFAWFNANSQTTQILGAPNVRIANRGDMSVDSIFYVPRTIVTSRAPFQSGALRYQASDSALYHWTGTAWRRVSPLIDTGAISTRAWRQKGIDSIVTLISTLGGGTVLSVSAGTGMNFTTITTSGSVSADTNVLATRANRDKLKDSLQANIAGKVNISDTATMLSAYLRKADTTSMLSPYLRKADTTAMLAPYVRNAGFGLTKGTQALSVDSALMATRARVQKGIDSVASLVTTIDSVLFSTRAWRQKGVDSVAALANTKATATGTTNYLSKFTGTSSLGNSIVYATTSEVGISTPSPTESLDVNGRVRVRTIDSTATGMNMLYADASGVIKKAAVPAGGSGSVTSVSAGTGMSFTTITTTGSVSADTVALATRAWRQKGIDSVANVRVGGSGTTNYVPKFTASGTIGNSQIFDNGTNVGISTSSPQYTFDINGAFNASGNTYISSSSGNARLVSGGGNVGIGISTTGAVSDRLHLNDGYVRYGFSPSFSTIYGRIGHNGNSGGFEILSQHSSGNDASSVIRFINGLAGSTSEKMRLTAAGRLLVGTTTEGTFLLDVNGTARTGTLTVNTNGQGQTISTFQPTGSSGNNLFIGGGGTSSSYTSGEDGANNVSVGVQALSSNTRGNRNVAIGVNALRDNTTAENNVAIGLNALVFNNGNQNVAIGRIAGQFTNAGGNVTGASNSVFIGHDSRPSTATPTNEIVIGNAARGNGSNTATYGNSSMVSHVFPAGNVGIGTTSPDSRLSVIGDGTGIIRMGSGVGGNSATIGLTGAISSTNYTLSGDAGNSNLAINRPTGGAMSFRSNGSAQMTLTSAGRLLVGTETEGTNTVDINGTLRTVNGANFATTSGGVGIGTTTIGTDKLRVVETGSNVSRNVATFTSNVDTANGWAGISVGTRGNEQYTVQIRATNTQSSPGFLEPRMDFRVQNSSTFLPADVVTRMTILNNGNVGIGTTSPSEVLHVVGRGRFTTIDSTSSPINMLTSDVNGVIRKAAIPTAASVDTNSIATRARVQKAVDSINNVNASGTGISGYINRWSGSKTMDTSQIFQQANRIGIGTTTPDARLVVVGDGTGLIRIGGGVGGNTASIGMTGVISSTAYTLAGDPGTGNVTLNRPSGGALSFAHANTEQARFDGNGTFLINTTTSDANVRLRVNGRARVETIDSSAAPINMLWADNNGVIRKAAVPSGGGGSGTVTSVATGFGIDGGTITTTGTLTADTFEVASRLRLYKVADSLAALSRITGSGTANYVPLFTSSTALGNSSIFEQSSEVRIGTTSDAGAFRLQVNGVTYSSGGIRTDAPSGGTAQTWKFGSAIADSVALDGNNYLEVEVNGVFYRIALITLL